MDRTQNIPVLLQFYTPIFRDKTILMVALLWRSIATLAAMIRFSALGALALRHTDLVRERWHATFFCLTVRL